ncbi:MAG: carboxylating nicotinate-nucleotide diphosphorylase [Actinomycetota bacterium]|nr:carboxylating nicotinate-nucleotide diphosphorylase [Actinomycetota bacterium]
MMPSTGTVVALQRAGLNPAAVWRVAQAALEEDLAGGVDVTSVATVPATAVGTALLVARGSGVLAGVPVAVAVFEAAAAGVTSREFAQDGDVVQAGQAVLEMRGPVRALLTAERSALNLLCHLSGVATLTRAWVEALAGTGAQVRDTRKTLPGLRELEKYAVRCGGGVNHRMGLSDAALVKDNHVLAAGGVAEAFEAVRRLFPGVPVEVECDTVEQVRAVLEAGADLLLLDNMTPETLREAVALCRERGVLTEASGGLTLASAGEVAATGVDYLAVGALTHSAPVLDIGVDLVVEEGGS